MTKTLPENGRVMLEVPLDDALGGGPHLEVDSLPGVAVALLRFLVPMLLNFFLR
jgi:hypothetical protein